MSGGEVKVDDSALRAVSGDLGGVGDALHTQAEQLSLRPDAGRSSHEVARAVAGLATTVAGLAEQIGSFAATLDATVADYVASDARTAERVGGPGTPR